jgi:2-aminoadipate transaminase
MGPISRRLVLHIKLDKSNPLAAYRQIADQLAHIIREGALADRERLPASRDLAKSLGVNRVTVVAAYELLEQEGLVKAHVGRGTYVRAPQSRGSAAPEGTPTGPSPSRFWSSQFAESFSSQWARPSLRAPEGTIFLDYALPPTDLFLVDQFRRSLNSALKKHGGEALQMGQSDGFAPLKDYIASHMTRMGIPTQPNEILITNGCQQGLDLVRRVFVGYDDSIVLEEPTYPGAINVFSGGRIRKLTVPMTESGADMETIESLLSQNKVKLIYTIPDFHNPTGATMGMEGRERLLKLARYHRVPIVEDGTYVELRYDEPALPSIKAMDDGGIVLYLSSFSKVNFPGIRVGWIAGPREAIEQLEAAKRTSDLHTDLLAQTGLYEFCRRGLLDQHIKRVKRIYMERRDAMLEALDRYLPPSVSWIRPAGGLALWLTAPGGVDSEALLRAAVARGVAFSCGKGFYSGPPDPRTLRLCFAAAGPQDIDLGIRRLARALEETMAQTREVESERSLFGRPMV